MVVAESLRVGTDLRIPITGLQRVSAGNAVDGQPLVWTMCAVSCADDEADALAAALAEVLEPGPWYADLAGPQLRYVVFSRQVFRYASSQPELRYAARAYGRSVGVPETQLDWA
jgi:hypothetical protein